MTQSGQECEYEKVTFIDDQIEVEWSKDSSWGTEFQPVVTKYSLDDYMDNKLKILEYEVSAGAEAD